MEEVGVRGGWGGAAGAGSGMRLKGLAGSVVVSLVGQVEWKAICSIAVGNCWCMQERGHALQAYTKGTCEECCGMLMGQGVLRSVDEQHPQHASMWQCGEQGMCTAAECCGGASFMCVAAVMVPCTDAQGLHFWMHLL